MTPLSAITQSMSSFGAMPGTGAVRPDAMPMPGVQAPSPLGAPTEVNPSQPSGDSFGNVLGRMISDVNAKQVEAQSAVSGLQSGKDVSLHQAVVAMEEANVSFQLMVEVRNKLLDSYQEIMRMQI